jgi:hypothetical protein
LAAVGADLSAPPSIRRIPTVLPLVRSTSSGRITPAVGHGGILPASRSIAPLASALDRDQSGRAAIDLDEGSDHDRIEGVGVGRGGRTGSVRSNGRRQEPSVPDDSSVDFSVTAPTGQHGDGKFSARTIGQHRRGGSSSSTQTVSTAGKPLVLVLDNPGGHRRGSMDCHSRSHREQLLTRSHLLQRNGRPSTFRADPIPSNSPFQSPIHLDGGNRP